MIILNNLNFLKTNLIAHRGYHSKELGIPENSMKAFKRAIDNNYIIELDAHLLKDGNVVVFHDDNLKRLTGIDKLIKNTTYDEIKKLKIYNTDQTIPLLTDVLKLVNCKVPLLIEIKYDVKTGLLEKKLIEILQNYRGLYAFQSFSPFSLYYLKKHCSNISRGLLVSNFKNDRINIIKKILLKNMVFNFLAKPDFISVNYKYVSNKKIQKLRNKKLILTWTIRNKDDYNNVKELCDNYIFENIVIDN